MPPVFCDYYCEHASFPEEDGIDGSGSCRTFLAVWCSLLEEYVPKNGKCRAAARGLFDTETSDE